MIITPYDFASIVKLSKAGSPLSAAVAFPDITATSPLLCGSNLFTCNTSPSCVATRLARISGLAQGTILSCKSDPEHVVEKAGPTPPVKGPLMQKS